MGICHPPEHVVFAIDMSQEMADKDLKGFPCSRLDLVKEGIVTFINAKVRMHSGHRFSVMGLKDVAHWGFKGLDRSPAEAIQFISNLGHHHLGKHESFEIGSIPQLTSELHSEHLLRVVLIYGRSDVTPSWKTCTQGQLGMDVLYLHHKPEENINCPQEVYNFLTEVGDAMSNRVEYSAYIHELSGQQLKRTQSTLALSISHGSQRPRQTALRPALDLAKELQPSTSAERIAQPSAPHTAGITRTPPSSAPSQSSFATVSPSASAASLSGSVVNGQRTWKGVLVNTFAKPDSPSTQEPVQESTTQGQQPSDLILVDLVVPEADVPDQQNSQAQGHPSSTQWK
ncbi:hypothetical protein BSKO_03910 [Bryopsis sp. KO-2023]|nr:hypothetical protein BSKO_03910 [Bryopsis sp. KO-2023]